MAISAHPISSAPISASASGGFVGVAIAAETESATALTVQKIVTVGAASESSSGTTTSAAKGVGISSTEELDFAGEIRDSIIRPSAEVSGASVVAAAKGISMLSAAESESASSTTPAKAISLGLSMTTDAATMATVYQYVSAVVDPGMMQGMTLTSTGYASAPTGLLSSIPRTTAESLGGAVAAATLTKSTAEGYSGGVLAADTARPTLSSGGTGYDIGILDVDLSRTTLSSAGTADALGSLDGSLQRSTLAALSGGYAAIETQNTTATATGSADALGQLTATLNKTTISASGSGDAIGGVSQSLERTTLECAGGGVVAVTLRRLTAGAAGTSDALGRLTVTLSRTTLATSTTVDIVGSLTADLPRTEMLYGLLSATLQRPTLIAAGSVSETLTAIAYAMNLQGGGLMPYSNYDFDFIVRFRGKSYGMNSVGAYLLEGDDDNGTNISAYVELPPLDFGATNEKRGDAVYIGSRTAGAIVVQSTVDEDATATVYTVQHGRNKRAKLPKGLKGRYWGFKISNSGGSNLDIDNIEILPAVSARKARG